VQGIFLDPQTGKKRYDLDVNARVVVLAAGAVYSPYFLLRQGICNSSGQVGKNLQIHPAVQTVALFDRPLDPPKGIPQACYVDDFREEGIMLEGGTVPPEIHALALPFTGKKHVQLMKNYPRMGIFGGMVSDTASWGRVVNVPRAGWRPTMFYMLRGKDVEKAKFAVSLMAQIWFASGAQKVITPIVGHYEIRGPSDLRRLERSVLSAKDFYAMSAYHPLGTCRMGDDPEWSVVKSTGETWDVENLYICDGSVLPSSPGVNPQLTIMALAIRCAGFIDERLSGNGSSGLSFISGKEGQQRVK
jgi:choline dehydrogenase-like flavoprotein